MSISVLTVKGQTTIPKKIRNYLNLHTGDKLDFTINKEGKVVLEPATLDIGQLKGILHRSGMKHVTIEEMKKAVKTRYNAK